MGAFACQFCRGPARRRSRWRWAAWPVSVVAAITLAVLTPSAANGAQEPAPVSVPQRYLDQNLDWEPCWFDPIIIGEVPTAPRTLCAKITVPMDWRHPDDHPDITLAIAHSRATGTSRGLLTSNPGGPGAGGLEFTAALALSKLSMFTDYDLLGFDPRGFGASETVGCYATRAEWDALPHVDDFRVRNKKTHTVEVARSKLFGKVCSSSELSRFVNTQQTVYDLDFLRRYLGQDKPNYAKLNYIGYSYGTWLGTWYADTYPDRVGRFILDSNMNWTSSMYASQAAHSFSFQRRRDKMFYPWLARHHQTYGLGSTSATVAKSYERIRADMLKAYLRGDFVPSPAEMDRVIQDKLYANWQFPDAASTLVDFKFIGAGSADAALRKRVDLAVRAATRGDRSAARAAPAPDLVEVYDAGQVVRCNDSAYSRNLTEVLKRADADAKKHPFVGYQNTLGVCNYWKFAPATRTIDLAGVPRMLMFESEGDPATPYEGALAAHKKAAAHTRLVSVDDEGQHGLYIDGPSPCVEEIGDSFLFGGIMPQNDVTCTTTPLPDDSRVYSLEGPLNGQSYRLDQRVRSLQVAKVNQPLREARTRAAALAHS